MVKITVNVQKRVKGASVEADFLHGEKTAHFCRFEGTKNGTSGARIKIPRPLLEIQTTPKTPN